MVEDSRPTGRHVLLRLIGSNMVEGEFPKRLQLPRMLERVARLLIFN